MEVEEMAADKGTEGKGLVAQEARRKKPSPQRPLL
jgi:hypothetical protein